MLILFEQAICSSMRESSNMPMPPAAQKRLPCRLITWNVSTVSYYPRRAGDLWCWLFYWAMVPNGASPFMAWMIGLKANGRVNGRLQKMGDAPFALDPLLFPSSLLVLCSFPLVQEWSYTWIDWVCRQFERAICSNLFLSLLFLPWTCIKLNWKWMAHTFCFI